MCTSVNIPGPRMFSSLTMCSAFPALVQFSPHSWETVNMYADLVLDGFESSSISSILFNGVSSPDSLYVCVCVFVCACDLASLRWAEYASIHSPPTRACLGYYHPANSLTHTHSHTSCLSLSLTLCLSVHYSSCSDFEVTAFSFPFFVCVALMH